MKRRSFVKHTALAGAGLALPWIPRPIARLHGGLQTRSLAADVVVIGGGVGGVAATLAAARHGLRVILTEETDWIGGQLTQQGVPPDENPWVAHFGATASYRRFRAAVRQYYRTWYPLTGAALRDEHLNPGGCAVSALCHEPQVALAVLEAMLAPYVSQGLVHILHHTVAVAAAVDQEQVRVVLVRNSLTADELELTGHYFLDATELGDLIPLTNTAYVTGAEAQSETGEPHAPAVADPTNMQAPTWCFAVDYRAGEDHTIERPAQYDFWRDYVPALTPPWPGRLLSLTYSDPITLTPRTVDFDPRPGARTENFNLWTYRRLIDPARFEPGAYSGGVSLINWPQNDYLLGNLIDVDADERARHEAAARQLSLSLVYWLQTEAPRRDDGQGWPGLRLRGDLLGTSDGLAKRPYIREARRIQAVFTVTEQHVGLAARMAATGLPRGEAAAAVFDDAVGIGSYRIDLHPSTGGDNYIDISSLPFEIPLGALIPRSTDNLLAAAKNLGVTHITNGCYRLHPVEWNVGEAAGVLAAHCVAHGLSPRQVQATPRLLQDYQRRLQQDGITLHWPQAATTPR